MSDAPVSWRQDAGAAPEGDASAGALDAGIETIRAPPSAHHRSNASADALDAGVERVDRR